MQLNASLTLADCTIHFSTRARLRSLGRIGVIPTVDGWTLRGCGVLLERRNRSVAPLVHCTPRPSAVLALVRGIALGFTATATLFATATATLPFIL